MAAPSNATSWMLRAARALREASSRGPEADECWTSFLQTLVSFRESLSCTVCKRIVEDARLPRPEGDNAAIGGCQHHVCATCMGKKKILRPSCSWCKDYDAYDPCPTLDNHVRVYKGMCTHCRSLKQFPLVCDKSFVSARTAASLPEGIHPITLDSLTGEPELVAELVPPPPPSSSPVKMEVDGVEEKTAKPEGKTAANGDSGDDNHNNHHSRRSAPQEPPSKMAKLESAEPEAAVTAANHVNLNGDHVMKEIENAPPLRSLGSAVQSKSVTGRRRSVHTSPSPIRKSCL